MSLSQQIIQRGKELRSYPDDIEEKLNKFTDNDEKRNFLINASNLFIMSSGIYSESRREVMSCISHNYASTFENSIDGYFDFFRKTGFFVSEDNIPLTYALQKKMTLDEISQYYFPNEENIKLLITNYPMKKVVSTYAKKRKKTHVIGALMDLGMSIEDFEKAKIYLSEKQYDELIGW